eukprot:COSAG02_NODE_947_length_15716_cov_7.567971_18_plen_66_part_00
MVARVSNFSLVVVLSLYVSEYGCCFYELVHTESLYLSVSFCLPHLPHTRLTVYCVPQASPALVVD